MKKYLIMILSLATIFCFAGCSGNNNTSNQNSTVENSDTSTVENSDTSTVENSDTSTVESNDTLSTSDTSTQSENDTVVVPDVVGMNIDEATKKLEELGLTTKVKVMHLVHKDKNDYSLGRYDEGYVLGQDSKSGTVMVKGSTIELTYNSNTCGFEYKTNDNGTITLTMFTSTYCPEHIFKIPLKYDDLTVSSINGDLIDVFHRYFPHIKIMIPKDISIIGTFTAPVEYY